MTRIVFTALTLFCWFFVSIACADDTIKLKNSFENDIVLLFKPESAKEWTRIKIADGKTGELKVDFDGICEIKIEVDDKKTAAENREFHVGSFDLKKLISQNEINELQIHVDVVDAKTFANEINSARKRISAPKGQKTTKMVPVTKVRSETKTRMVTVTKADGTVVTVPQTYTVQVSYIEMVEQEVEEDATGGKKKTKLVPETKFRSVTRTYMETVTKADGTVVTVPRTRTERIPYTVMVEKELDGDAGQGDDLKDADLEIEFAIETRSRAVPYTEMKTETRVRDVEIVDEKTGKKRTAKESYLVHTPTIRMRRETYEVRVPNIKVKSSNGNSEKAEKNGNGFVIRPIVTFKKDGRTVRLKHSTDKESEKK
jgi:hypothetical protein